MKKTIKKIVLPFIPQSILNIRTKRKDRKTYKSWEKNGFKAPSPHIVKQNTIKEYQKEYGLTTLVETGTYMGDMVEAQKSSFQKIYSIELDTELFEKAKKRFKKDKNIQIVQGDSGKVLPEVIKNLSEPSIFWLDGHYSAGITAKGDKDCPIFEELESIFKKKEHDHILLIDDARCFIGEGDYPTIEALSKFIKEKNDKYVLEVKHDIIRFVVPE
jgi:hypothetical protein